MYSLCILLYISNFGVHMNQLHPLWSRLTVSSDAEAMLRTPVLKSHYTSVLVMSVNMSVSLIVHIRWESWYCPQSQIQRWNLWSSCSSFHSSSMWVPHCCVGTFIINILNVWMLLFTSYDCYMCHWLMWQLSWIICNIELYNCVSVCVCMCAISMPHQLRCSVGC